MTAIDASLRRLGADYVDLYQIHRFDPRVPLEETLEALYDVVKAGKARYLGASSIYAWQFTKGPVHGHAAWLDPIHHHAEPPFQAIRECAVPVIAAVDRAVIGGGVALVACCDTLSPATGPPSRSPRSTWAAGCQRSPGGGPYRAREMVLAGHTAPAAELAAAGAISQVVTLDKVQEVALEYARTLAGKSPLALRLAKESLNRSEHLPFDEGLPDRTGLSIVCYLRM